MYDKHLPQDYGRCSEPSIDPPDDYWGPCETCSWMTSTCHLDCEDIVEEVEID